MLPLKSLNLISFCSSFKNLLQIRSCVPLCSNYISSRVLEKKLGFPEKPKKPLTPYFRYMKESRPLVVASNPKASITDVVKIVAKNWSTIDENKKKQLAEEYRKEQYAYMQLRAAYESKLTDEQKANLKNCKQELLDVKEKRELKKKTTELGKPKRPASAFIKFLAVEKQLTPIKGNSYREWQTEAAEKWKKLTDEEKEKYTKAHMIDAQKYRVELSKWEEKMIRLGNIDVVRHEALIEPPPPKPHRRLTKIVNNLVSQNSLTLSEGDVKDDIRNTATYNSPQTDGNTKKDEFLLDRDTSETERVKKEENPDSKNIEKDINRTNGNIWKLFVLGLIEPNWKEYFEEFEK